MSIKNCILEYLKEQKMWVYGGTIEREAASASLCKESIARRRTQELAEDGLILKRLVKNPIKNRNNQVVMYKAKI